MSTNELNNEEALEENMGAGRVCLFLRCSSKQTTSLDLVEAAFAKRPHSQAVIDSFGAIAKHPGGMGCRKSRHGTRWRLGFSDHQVL